MVKKRYNSRIKGPFLAQKVEEDLMGLELKGDFQIRKWSPSYPRDGGVSLGRSPSFLPATKSERFQSIPELWKTHGDAEFQITEILDGMPMIFYEVTDSKDLYSQLPGVIIEDEAENGVFPRESHGVSIGEHDYEETEASISWKAVKEQRIICDIRHAINIGLAGVLCGTSIAGNPLMVDGHRFYVYAMCDDFKAWKTTDDHDDEWRGQLATLDRVPKFATRVRLSAFAKDLDELMTKAQGASCVSEDTRYEYPSLKRKGLAFRALDGSFSFKVIANDWLLDETEKLRKAGQDEMVSRPGPDDCI
ncbi:hypothetical protein INS49_002784 [Diaporthe citri]|uniref:uncharacterized protein n=1 Tax=Diaporthe citri TaxID=83186 RepID=UPI001C82642A|nr:uncharacterized protein INS49_002784 [Diaporthe citri]KAG6368571.1 hypothetical protein INS49_002784 [Diaporthe citri]